MEGLATACESLCNGVGYLIEDQNQPGAPIVYSSVKNLPSIYHNGTYKLIREKSSVENIFATQANCFNEAIDESFLRKYERPFEVKLHREAIVAFEHMNFGEFFYECTSSSRSRVKVIFARYDQTREELQVFSRKHLIKRIPISAFESVLPGIHSEPIKKYLTNKYDRTSLTIYYKHQGILFQDTKELALTFRTERQFDVWTAGLKAALALNRSEVLSKKQLLQHSRLFNRFFNTSQFQLVDQFFNNSAIYQQHLIKEGCDSPTYEASLLDRRIVFCFEKQVDEIKQEITTFKTSNLRLSTDMKKIVNLFFDNITIIAKQTIKQIQTMKLIIEDLQKAKTPAPLTKDLLDLESDEKTKEDSLQREESQRQSNIHARAKKIKYYYQEIFKFQYRLDQSNLLLSYFNKPPKK